MNDNNFRNNKNIKINNKIFIIFFIIIGLCIISGSVYAYLTYKASIENTFVLGFNTIKLQEFYEPPITMAKGISFRKEPYVTNTGNVDCYVRIKSLISDSRVESGITIDYNTDDFTYNDEDGYWYYNQVIAPEERTNSLFTTVSVLADADDNVLDGFDIYVYAESVQTVKGKTMQETWNYFE